MRSRTVRYPLVIRLLIFAVLLALFGYLLAVQKWTLAILLTISILISLADLIYHINGISRKLSFFFDAVRNEDSTLHFPEKVSGKSMQNLHKSLNRLNELISEIKIRNEYNERFFRELLKYSSTGIMAVDDQGYIDLINDAALDLLGMKNLAHLRLLQQKRKEIYDAMQLLKPGQTQTLKLLTGEELRQLSIKLAKVQFGNKQYNVFSIYDIKAEMEENELDSWQKLIRVLTHEIMNSVAPITSLSNTLAKIYSTENFDIPDNEAVKFRTDKTIEGLSVIEETGKGLMHFIDNYRKLTRLPKPSFKPIGIKRWFDRIEVLMSEKLKEHNIQLEIAHKAKLNEFIGDEKLLTQVMINLLNNAVDALSGLEDKKVKIRTSLNRQGRFQIDVIDNGNGIPESELENIFVPFFTTKEKGSGIGLSLARQIMRLHKGSITVSSVSGRKTVFRLMF